MGFLPGVRWSGPDEAGDRLGGLADLLVGLAAARLGGLDDAVRQVLLDQAERDRLQRLRHRRDPGEDVDAVLLVLDHPLQPAGLTLDAAQPLEVVVLAVDVAVLATALHGCPPDASGGRSGDNRTPLGHVVPRVVRHRSASRARSRSTVACSRSESARASASSSCRPRITSAEARVWPSSSRPRSRAARASWWRE